MTSHPSAGGMSYNWGMKNERELATETIAYQALLEGHRRDPDNEELWADVTKARAAMEVAWLARSTGSED